MRQRLGAIALAMCAALVMCTLGACSGPAGGSRDSITIAYQPGLGYAPLLIAKQQRLLEKKFPDKKFTWKTLDSGSAIRDGMLAGQIQIGAGGTGPFLVGHSKGVPWRIVTSLDDSNLKLMAKDPKIKSVKDLKGKGKIATPGPDSIQAVVLRRAAEKELGNPKALDSQLVSMGHPDGLQALESGQIKAHLTSPPFQQQEKDKGARELMGSKDVFGQHTFNGVEAITDFARDNSEVVDELRRAVAQSVQLLNNNPEKASALLAAEGTAGKSTKILKQQISADDIAYTTKPRGYYRFATFMKTIGLVKKVPKRASSLFFTNPATKGGT